MSNTKYTPLEDTPESVNLPPYELNDLNNPEIDTSQEGGSSTYDGDESSQPTPVNEDILDLFSRRKEDEFEKSYSFKIKSSIIEERAFRLYYFPKHGIEGFRKQIDEKIQYTTQSSSSIPFAIGYFDQYKDLITISNDQDLLGCVHWNNITHHYQSHAIQLIVYDIRNHSAVAKQYKNAKMRKCGIIGGSVVLSILLVVFLILGIVAFFR